VVAGTDRAVYQDRKLDGLRVALIVIRLLLERLGPRANLEPGDGRSVRRDQTEIVTAGLEGGVKVYSRANGVVIDLENRCLHFRRCEADLRSVLEVTATDRDLDVGPALSAVREDPANIGTRRRHLLRHNNHGHETGQSEP